ATALSEWEGIPGVTNCNEIAHLGPTSAYKLTLIQDGNLCHIDWSRDGVIAPAGTTVMASPTWVFGDTQYPELGRPYWQWFSTLPNDVDQFATPGIARVDGRLYLAYSRGSTGIEILYSDDTFGQGCASEAHGCATFANLTITQAHPDAGVGPLLADLATGTELLLVWVEASTLHYMRIDKATHNTLQTGAVYGAWDVVHEPTLAWDAQGRVAITYRTGIPGGNGLVFQTSYDPISTSWTWPNNLIQGSAPVNARAVVATGSMPGPNGTVRTFIVLHQENGAGLALRWFEIIGGTVTPLSNTNLYPETSVIDKRGSLVLRARGIGNAQRLYFTYVPTEPFNPPARFRRQIRVQMTQELGASDVPSFMPITLYDNGWQHQFSGTAMLGWHGQSTGTTEEESTRMVHFFRPGNPAAPPWHDPVLVFRPFADDIANITLKDTNDWAVIGENTCAGLHNENGHLCSQQQGYSGDVDYPYVEVVCHLD
ncbi:MAG: hypothetical protein KAI47_23660, partial [Deltaproteobacteria bacterium]|nr:hypothetical protein [Deltaproteobacteria bacterium]